MFTVMTFSIYIFHFNYNKGFFLYNFGLLENQKTSRHFHSWGLKWIRILKLIYQFKEGIFHLFKTSSYNRLQLNIIKVRMPCIEHRE